MLRIICDLQGLKFATKENIFIETCYRVLYEKIIRLLLCSVKMKSNNLQAESFSRNHKHSRNFRATLLFKFKRKTKHEIKDGYKFGVFAFGHENDTAPYCSDIKRYIKKHKQKFPVKNMKTRMFSKIQKLTTSKFTRNFRYFASYHQNKFI